MAKCRPTRSATPPRRPPVAAAAASRQNKKKRKKKSNEQNVAIAGCVAAVTAAVVLQASGLFDSAKFHPKCVDRNPRCPELARKGMCDSNPWEIVDLCRRSCDVCDAERLRNLQARYDMGVEQQVDYDGEHGGMTYRVISMMHDYYRKEVVPLKRYTPEIQAQCGNKNESCALWAGNGMCKTDQKMMVENCAAACRYCYKLICPLEEGGPYVWGPGALNNMFMRIVADPKFAEWYTPKIHSRPAELANDGGGGFNDDGASDGPWVVTLQNFLTPEECDNLVASGAALGYQTSQTFTDSKGGGHVSSRRTSTNAWCKGVCSTDPMNQGVVERIANLTGVPEENQEDLQLLRYEKGQYYGVHRDYNADQRPRQEGVRILTVFLYLNDEGLEGGGTNFPGLNDLTIQPKRGQALIWPNVKNEAPNEEDKRMNHQALPVIKGVKYGANAWIHMRDYRGPQMRDCL